MTVNPHLALRPLALADIPKLAQIRPRYFSETVLEVERLHDGLSLGWRLTEKPLAVPFDKGSLYDFSGAVQDEIRVRLGMNENACEWVAVEGQRIVGILDAEYRAWNNTVFIWNLMIDQDYRRMGLGRQLWEKSVTYGREREARAITLETQHTNVPACKFYLKMGCQLVGLDESLYTNAPALRAPRQTMPETALFFAYSLT